MSRDIFEDDKPARNHLKNNTIREKQLFESTQGKEEKIGEKRRVSKSLEIRIWWGPADPPLSADNHLILKIIWPDFEIRLVATCR